MITSLRGHFIIWSPRYIDVIVMLMWLLVIRHDSALKASSSDEFTVFKAKRRKGVCIVSPLDQQKYKRKARGQVMKALEAARLRRLQGLQGS